MKMPVLFIGHGSPMNVLLENDYTRRLADLGKELPKPKAILVISAHWLTDGTFVTCVDKPKTIYDFYGFPSELYRIKYAASGAPEVAKAITELVKKPQVQCDLSWGLDHAAWAVLKHIFPNADIPVMEMSLDYSPYNGWTQQTLKYFYDLAQQLTPLRERGILMVGSGNVVHNLRVVDMANMDAKPYDWAIEFDERVKRNLVERNHADLLDCQNMSRATSLSIPTLDHYIPMVFAIGLQGKSEELTFVHEGFQNRSISMRCFRVG